MASNWNHMAEITDFSSKPFSLNCSPAGTPPAGEAPAQGLPEGGQRHLHVGGVLRRERPPLLHRGRGPHHGQVLPGRGRRHPPPLLRRLLLPRRPEAAPQGPPRPRGGPRPPADQLQGVRGLGGVPALLRRRPQPGAKSSKNSIKLFVYQTTCLDFSRSATA